MDRIPPPFQPGDKVVRINESSQEDGMIVGNHYTVESIWWCCTSIGYRLTVCEVSMKRDGIPKCVRCDRPSNGGWLASNFRKIDELSSHTTESLLEELEQPVLV